MICVLGVSTSYIAKRVGSWNSDAREIVKVLSVCFVIHFPVLLYTSGQKKCQHLKHWDQDFCGIFMCQWKAGLLLLVTECGT